MYRQIVSKCVVSKCVVSKCIVSKYINALIKQSSSRVQFCTSTYVDRLDVGSIKWYQRHRFINLYKTAPANTHCICIDNSTFDVASSILTETSILNETCILNETYYRDYAPRLISVNKQLGSKRCPSITTLSPNIQCYSDIEFGEYVHKYRDIDDSMISVAWIDGMSAFANRGGYKYSTKESLGYLLHSLSHRATVMLVFDYSRKNRHQFLDDILIDILNVVESGSRVAQHHNNVINIHGCVRNGIIKSGSSSISYYEYKGRSNGMFMVGVEFVVV